MALGSGLRSEEWEASEGFRVILVTNIERGVGEERA